MKVARAYDASTDTQCSVSSMEAGETIYSGGSHLISFVWKSLEFYKRGGKLDKTRAICRTAVPYKSATKIMKMYLQRRHSITKNCSNGDTAETTHKIKDTAVTQNFQAELPHNLPRVKVISESIAHFIAKDLHPNSMVENDGFHFMIHTLEPRYHIPSRSHFTDTRGPAIYYKAKKEVEQALADAERVALPTDAWTSCATIAYVTITSHHISPQWELKSHVLPTRVFNESHTGINLGTLLREACVELKIADKEPARVTVMQGT